MKNYLYLLFGLFLISCEKEKTSDLAKIESQLKTDNLYTSEFILKNDTLLKGKLGTEIAIPFDLFDNYTNGKIKFELKEYFTKEDMILNGLSTITDKDELLESSGMIYINFTEEGKQLNIKEGKKFTAKFPNTILEKSNIYTNDNDSIFKWKFIEPIKVDTSIIDIVKNYRYKIAVDASGAGGYFKDINRDSIQIIRKRDSLQLQRLIRDDNNRRKQTYAQETLDIVFDDGEYVENTDINTNNKLTSQEKKEKIVQRNDFYQKNYKIETFTASKLGWINCDRVINVEKSVTLSLNIANHEEVTNFSIYYIYKNYKTFLKESFTSCSSIERPFKIAGKAKVVVVSNSNEKYLYDVFYVNKDSKINFDIKLKETTLGQLKTILVSQ
ncbi:hypothetical protein [Flavobacterium sp.]|uniref:hypothetical protein n=1 Tax=Flavobacterium sp. TaxID=239 RepID=UPI0040475840